MKTKVKTIRVSNETYNFIEAERKQLEWSKGYTRLITDSLVKELKEYRKNSKRSKPVDLGFA